MLKVAAANLRRSIIQSCICLQEESSRGGLKLWFVVVAVARNASSEFLDRLGFWEASQLWSHPSHTAASYSTPAFKSKTNTNTASSSQSLCSRSRHVIQNPIHQAARESRSFCYQRRRIYITVALSDLERHKTEQKALELFRQRPCLHWFIATLFCMVTVESVLPYLKRALTIGTFLHGLCTCPLCLCRFSPKTCTIMAQFHLPHCSWICSWMPKWPSGFARAKMNWKCGWNHAKKAKKRDV